MSKGKFYLLDTFSREPFQGNPTPICVLEKELDTDEMTALAKEFNAPVTAFVSSGNAKGSFRIRYFTVEGEIPACGHASLGAGSVLLKEYPRDKVEFLTTEGIRIQSSRQKDRVFLEYPAFPWKEYHIPSELLKALALEHYDHHFYCEELQALFIEIESSTSVQQVAPDFKRLRASSDEIKEVVIMSKSTTENYDFILRSFCPWIGIDEDPVTGSIHSVLGPYLSERTGKTDLMVYQASSRGGEIAVSVGPDSVKIGGHSRVIIEGMLKL